MDTIVIQGEEQAFELLSNAVAGELKFLESPRVEFKGWPQLDVYLPQTPVEASISPTMMAAFIKLQEAINRSYALIALNSTDLRVLTTDHREQLEIRVEVRPGSSGYIAELSKVLEQIGIEAVGKMDQVSIVVTILGLGVIIASASALLAWIAERRERRVSDLAEKQLDSFVEMHKAALSAGTEHMRILAEAKAKQPLLGEIEAVMEPARLQLIRSIGKEGGGKIQGIDLDQATAQEIGAQKRQQGEDVRIAGAYKVVKVDTSVPDGFRVTLANDREEIVASMLEALSSEAHKAAIQKAEWAKRPVYVELKARKLGGKYVDATVVNAREITEADTESRDG